MARSCLLALGLLLAVPHVAGADPPHMPSLLKALDLRGYPARTMAPAFTGSTLDSGPFSLADHRGSVLLLNFWATWCAECRSEMPALQQLQRELASRRFTIVGINARERKDVAARYIRDLGLTFPIVLDTDGAINGLYGVVALPTTFVVARDGRAIGIGIGPREWSGPAARAFIQVLLDEPAPGPRDR